MTTKLYSGCYRVTSVLSFAYGHIVRGRNGMWTANIHHGETGQCLRPAGLWNTLREARLEVTDLLWRDYRVEA